MTDCESMVIDTPKATRAGDCRVALDSIVEKGDGIVSVQLNTQSDKVQVLYDSAVASETRARKIAREASYYLQNNRHNCSLRAPQKNGEGRFMGCAHCLGQLVQEGSTAAASSSLETSESQVSIEGPVLTVSYGHRTVGRIKQVALDLQPAKTVKQALGKFFSGHGLQALAVFVTLGAMIAGAILERSMGLGLVTWIVYGIAYIAGGAEGLLDGIKTLAKGTIDVDLLMVLAAIGAAAIGAPFEGALLLFLFSLSNWLQDMAMDRAHSAIESLMQLRPDSAEVYRGGQWSQVPLQAVALGEHFRLKPGDRVPLDGVVVSGRADVDNSAITGESKLITVDSEQPILAGSINKTGSLVVAVTKRLEDSTLSRVIALVQNAQASKAKTESFLDAFEKKYAIAVILITLGFIFIPPLLFGAEWASSVYRAVTLMVAMSPCALVISTPASILSAIGNGARRGILFKGGLSVEKAGTAKVVALDKTGTLTQGRPSLHRIVPLNGGASSDRNQLLNIAAAIEAKSEHPLAVAVTEALEGKDPLEVSNFEAVAGSGVSGTVAGQDYTITNPREVDQYLTPMDRELVNQSEGQGLTTVVLSQKQDTEFVPLACISFRDKIRSSSAQAVAELKAIGIEQVVMLTGDAQVVADAIGTEAGVDRVFAQLKPQDKHKIVAQLQREIGPVVMVGDGINDAPALAQADVGVAMGAAGTDVALESADLVLMADDLKALPYVMGLSRATRKTLIVNLALALGLMAIMVFGIFVGSLALPLAVFGHEGGTVLVSLNGLRLLFYKYGKPKVYKKYRRNFSTFGLSNS